MVRPFRIAVPDAEIADLRSRLRHTRWPSASPEPPWVTGVPPDWLADLVDHWARDYDWRRRERQLNVFPQVIVPVFGLDVHAVHLRSPHPHAVPVILTHGWPGAFTEYLRVAEPLVDPGAHGGDPADAVHLVLPSLPGYGFSAAPETPGWGVERIADAWVELMAVLGYDSFIAGGSDWGTTVSTEIGRRHQHRTIGLHLVPPLVAPDPATFDSLTTAESEALRRRTRRERNGSAYGVLHADRPQTLGYALEDSPAGLAAWIGEKYHDWVDHDGDLYRVVDRDDLLDVMSLYWFTRSASSSIRLYRESIAAVTRIFTTAEPERIEVPVGASMFPAEVPWVSRRWAERRFPRLVSWDTPTRGGHFGALEQPQAFVRGLRATLRALR